MNDNEYLKPEWWKSRRVHNWRNYINPNLQEIWHTFTKTQKKAIYENAEELASKEEWD